MGTIKKAFAGIIAVLVLTVSVAGAALAASSPAVGDTKKATTGTYVATNVKSGYASYKKVKKTSVKNDNISKNVTINGKTYKVNAIANNAYKGVKNLKSINVYSKYLTKVGKKAFAGISKAKLAKVKVNVTKKMSAARFNKLKKALIARGFKAKNIKRNL